jgi:hypothetical protein
MQKEKPFFLGLNIAPFLLSSVVLLYHEPTIPKTGMHNYTDSEFFERLIKPFMPYTVGAVVWDQAERDVHCLPAVHGLLPENEIGRQVQAPCSACLLECCWLHRRFLTRSGMLHLIASRVEDFVARHSRWEGCCHVCAVCTWACNTVIGLIPVNPRLHACACTAPL